MHVAYAYEIMGVQAWMHACRSQSKTFNVLFYCNSTFCLETGSPTEVETHNFGWVV